MSNYLKRKFPSLGSLGSDASASFLRAARGGNLDKVLDYIKNGTDINTCNQNGLNALHLASKEGHGHIVSELLNRGANVDAVTKKGNSALHVASLAGQEEIVRLLVQAGANVNAQSQNGFTPLYMAAQENHDAVVRYLLSNGANQSIATEDGFTPLAVALQQGHDKVVAVLLENDTRGKVRLPALHIAAKKDDCKSAVLLLQNDHKSDVTSKSGFTPLHIAAHYGNQNIAALLLDKGADINYMAKHHITPLHVAAKWGKANMVTLLCERGANQESKTRDGLTPLHCGARSGHENVVDLMLEKGAFISAKTKNGLTPLHMAAQGDHVDAARILFYHKAPVDDVTVDYLTALHVAAHCGHVKVAKLLLDRHADPNSRALNGFTPLHIACKKNRIEVVELLLKYGASIEATTESGLTPLHVASFMGCMNIVIYLLQHDAKPNHATVRGETPLHLAARANQADIIRILLRNRAEVDARAREQQTPLHIAARLGNADIVMMLLQHGAAVDSTTKDLYTALHIAAKEGQDEVAQVLMEHGASLSAVTKKGFTPLHLAAKYGNMRVAKTLLAKDAPVDAQGKNGVTPLHVAAHYDHQNVALLLLEKRASVKATAKNGYTPLHIAAKKDQMDIATTLLEYGAETNCESKAGFTPLHLAAQDGHSDMTTLLIEHMADVNEKAKNGLTPLHLCAQEDRVPVAAILVKHGAEVGPETAAGYTPLHVASHFGQLNMVRFLLQHQAEVNPVTSAGYTPLHQAAQQGHTLIISLLLEHKAQPNAVTNTGQTALSIAQRLGYISVVESLKVVTETVITTTTTTVTEEKYKVVAPETMQETFLSDSEDEGGDDFLDSAVYGRPSNAQHVYLPYYEGQMELSPEDQPLGDSTYKYLTVDEMKSLGDDSMPMDVSRDEFFDRSTDFHTDWISPAPPIEETISPQKIKESYAQFTGSFAPDNVDISRSPVTAGFLVSFMVDARGGAMRGCRHSGVRVIVPPRKAAQPMRITCRYLKKDKLLHPPPLMEGEAIGSRILEMGPAQAKFLGPVIIEVPHFAALRGREREIVILRSDNGETWKEHTLEASEEAVQEVLNESFDGDELKQLEDLNTSRITRIVTTDFPQYFAIVSRLRQEVHAIGTEGGMVSSTVVPQVQAVFQPGALTKKIKVGLQAQPIAPELVAKLLGNRVAVSPIVTIEPRRRKFHKPITLTIPVPQAAAKGMINQYSGDAPTLRLLCSITGGTTRAQWEDVTGSTPLTFVNDCVSFTTTVSARFWLMDCRNVTEATAMATELYKEAIHVPFMAKFVVFAKRHDPLEGRVRVFCMTDDKEEKTLEQQEHFIEVAKSRDVEVLEGKPLYLEFAGNLLPVTKSGDQLNFNFYSFRENRMPFNMRVKDHAQDPMGRVAFMREKKLSRQDAPQPPICNLNIQLPADICPEADVSADSERLRQRLTPLTVRSIGRLVRPEIHRADIRITDIAHKLGKDWVALAPHLDIPESDIQLIQTEYPDDSAQQATVMLRLWMNSGGHDATGNTLARGLQAIERDDIVTACITDSVMVTDAMEAAMAKARLDQSGFDSLREELGPSRDTSFRPDLTLDDRDIMKEAESVEDVRVSEVDKVEPVVTPSADADERKYAAEEKTVSSVVEPTPQPSAPEPPRPSRPLAPIAPKDGPATGQVTVSDLASPVEEEREIAPVHVTHPEVAEGEQDHKRRSMVLKELGDALAAVERTQPPVERPGRHEPDVSAVEEPVMVSEKKGLKSPVTPAMVIPTAAVRTEATPDGSKTTVMQQTSESVTDDGRAIQKSTTITTTTVGDTTDFAERLASEGDLQKTEAAPDTDEKDVVPAGAPAAAASQQDAASVTRGGSPGEDRASPARAAAPALSATTLDASSARGTPSPLVDSPQPAEEAAGRNSVSSWASSPPDLLDDYSRQSSSRSPSVTSSTSDVMERVLQPEVISGTPEAESYFRDQSRRMFKHVLRGELDIDVNDLDTLTPGSGLYVIEGDEEGDDTEVIVVKGGRGVPMPGAGLYVRPDIQEGAQIDHGPKESLPSIAPRSISSLPTHDVPAPIGSATAGDGQIESLAAVPAPIGSATAGDGQIESLAAEVGSVGVDGSASGDGSDGDAALGRSSSYERLCDGVELAAIPGASAVSAKQLETRVGDEFDTRTLPPACNFEDVYRRALDDDEDSNSDHSDESDGTYPSVIAAGPAVVERAADIVDELVRHPVSDAAVVSVQHADLDIDSDDEFEFLERQMAGEEVASGDDVERLMPVGADDEALVGHEGQLDKIPEFGADPGDGFELLDRQLLSEVADADVDDEFERLERQLVAEEEAASRAAVAGDRAVHDSAAQDVIVEDVQDVKVVLDETDEDPRQGLATRDAPSSPAVECLLDYLEESSQPKHPSPEPLVSTPTRSRRVVPVQRHETFHHVPRVTVTDADDVRDVTDDGEEGLVAEPDDDDSDSDAWGRPTIVELVDDDDDPAGASSESPQMFSELVEGISGQGPTLRRMVRTETRTQTTFDNEGRPVIRTVTEKITTEADGTETRETVETED